MSAMSAENNNIKRRKIDGSVSTDACCLTYLPKEALIHVATFLAAPSRALFAASLDGSSGSSGENISAIFPSNQLFGSGGSVNFQEISAQLAQSHVQKILWEMEALNQTDILDFEKITKEYVVQLSDDGIRTVLLCVDAVNTVKRLKLANCISITGVGLEPLRGSTMIEQIDLSLNGEHQNAEIDPEPPISCDAVVPILDSIISHDGCALKHLQFPYKWRRSQGQQSEIFVTRYNQMLTYRGGVRCLQCNENLPRPMEEWTYTYCGQNYTCYECLKHYCHECEDDDEECVLRWCNHCKRQYCRQCERMNWCSGCDGPVCVSCTEITECIECGENSCSKCCAGPCSGCGQVFCFGDCGKYDCEGKRCYKTFCNDCRPHCCLECECCYSVFCNECNKKIGANTVTFCEDCDTHYCGNCRVSSCQKQEKKGGVVCTSCVHLAHPLLVEETKQLKSQVEDLEEQLMFMKLYSREASEHLVIARHCLGLQSTFEKETERVDLRRLNDFIDYGLSADEVDKILRQYEGRPS